MEQMSHERRESQLRETLVATSKALWARYGPVRGTSQGVRLVLADNHLLWQVAVRGTWSAEAKGVWLVDREHLAPIVRLLPIFIKQCQAELRQDLPLEEANDILVEITK